MGTEISSWTVAPFETFRANLRAMDDLLHVSMRGLHLVVGFPHIVAAASSDLFPPEEVALFEREAHIAQREDESGYPLLHEQAVVTLWASLEALIRDFLAAWLANWPDARNSEKIRSLRLNLGEYEDLSPEEKSYYVLDLLEDSLKCRRRGGIERFEPVFAAFEMTSAVDSTVKKTLFELSRIRNALVHRRGVADSRLVELCPWLGYKVGDKVEVSHERYHGYLDASEEYTFEIIQRVRPKLGLPPSEHKALCRFARKDESA